MKLQVIAAVTGMLMFGLSAGAQTRKAERPEQTTNQKNVNVQKKNPKAGKVSRDTSKRSTDTTKNNGY